MLDVPVSELPWLALHSDEQYLESVLRLSKLPILRNARPMGYPAWNAVDKRVLRFWTTDGLDDDAIEALRAKEPVVAIEPDRDEFRRQMEYELIQCRAHLDAVLDVYR